MDDEFAEAMSLRSSKYQSSNSRVMKAQASPIEVATAAVVAAARLEKARVEASDLLASKRGAAIQKVVDTTRITTRSALVPIKAPCLSGMPTAVFLSAFLRWRRRACHPALVFSHLVSQWVNRA